VNYAYDGDGDRVQKSNGKIYWYGAGSEILNESDSSGNITDQYVYFGGKRIAHRVVSGNAIYYYAEDFLGTSRVMTTSTGTVCYDADFYPYGGERVVTNTCPQNYKFTGKERDAETNNDDFGARYYSSQFGRWTSPDWSAVPAPVPYANLTNPQTLNLYAMVSDNPETFSDLDGHCWPVCEVIAWVATHVAQVGIGISSTRNEYTARAAQATSSGERDALKVEMRAKGPALGRALADNAAADPARIAARAAKTEAQLTESITHTSAGVSATADAMGIVGKVAAPVAVGIAAYDVVTAPEGEKGRTAAGEAGGLGGAFAGGEVGAEAGAAIGTLFGPGPGTIIGAGIGGLVGAIGGGLIGNDSATHVYDDVTKKASSLK
jgi:RHS repeat-associated protein